MHRALHLMSCLALATLLATRPAPAADLRDLYFGEALYRGCQGQFFEALERLDADLRKKLQVWQAGFDRFCRRRRRASRDTPTVAQ